MNKPTELINNNMFKKSLTVSALAMTAAYAYKKQQQN
jgi:hypothetical protein